jgi:hypothetical protein
MVVVLGTITFAVPLKNRVPGPDLAKLVAVKLPESVETPD